jgi:hypothetical protein
MINLKHAHTAREGRLAQREAVEAGTNDDVLKYTELTAIAKASSAYLVRRTAHP